MNILQEIFSVKNKDNHKIFKILGFKFKIKNKYSILKKSISEQQAKVIKLENDINDLRKEQQANVARLEKEIKEKLEINTLSFWNEDEYVICNSLHESFVRQIDFRQFYKICSKYFAGKNIETFPPIDILIYIATSIQNGKHEKATTLLYQYCDIHGTDEIWRFIEVAKFAKELGITNDLIQKSSRVYEILSESRENKLFEKMLEDKTVALVGNGPSEVGKNKGQIIDSHDIVIRFNNYRIEGYENDYGKKTDIWVKCSSDDIKHENNDDNIKLIIYEPDYPRHILINGYLEPLCNNKIPIDYFDFDDHVCLRKKLNIFPSTGLVAIEKILFKCNVKKLDCYGFSFLEDQPSNYATHYYNDRSKLEAVQRSAHHSFNVETEYLSKLFG